MTQLIHSDEARRLEGYAEALQDVLAAITGESWNAKRYDPMTVDERAGLIHSYTYNLLGGGRHHPISHFDSPGHVKKLMLTEVCRVLREEIQQQARTTEQP